MATRTNNAANNAVNNAVNNVDEWRTDYKVENRKVMNVILSKENGRNGRVTLVLDGKPFKSYRYGTAEKIETNSISFDIANIGNEFGQFSEVISTAEGYMAGSAIPIPLISFALKGGTISINRLFKAKGERRESAEDTYTQDLFKTKVIGFTENLSQLALMQVSKLLDKLADQALKIDVTESKPSQTATFGLKLMW